MFVAAGIELVDATLGMFSPATVRWGQCTAPSESIDNYNQPFDLGSTVQLQISMFFIHIVICVLSYVSTQYLLRYCLHALTWGNAVPSLHAEAGLCEKGSRSPFRKVVLGTNNILRQSFTCPMLTDASLMSSLTRLLFFDASNDLLAGRRMLSLTLLSYRPWGV